MVTSDGVNSTDKRSTTNRPLKVCFMGNAGSGKDTTIYAVAHTLKMKGLNIDVIPEAARDAKYNGFQLDKATTINSQLWILGRQVENEQHCMRGWSDVIICNRSVFDGVAIARLNLKPFEAQNLSTAVFAIHGLMPYDMIFYLTGNFREGSSDGLRRGDIRQSNPEYINRTIDAFDKLIRDIQFVGGNVYSITENDPEKRTTLICQQILEKLQVLHSLQPAVA